MVEEHAVLRGMVMNGSRVPVSVTAPVIAWRTEKDFVRGLLRDLEAKAPSLSDTDVPTRDPDHCLKLYQPVHQVFQLAVVQADCDSFGGPRLDPAKIDSMGLVVRRFSEEHPGLMERWSKQDGTIAGWVTCADDDLDPDPARRRASTTTGNTFIDQKLPIPSPAYAPYTEAVAPLFAAPPGLCQSIKTTALFGVIPVTSTEKSELIPTAQYSAQDAANIRRHLPGFLQTEDSGKSQALAQAGQIITYTFASDLITSSDPNTAPDLAADALLSFINTLRQFQFEFNAFSDTDAAGLAIFQALNQYSVEFDDEDVDPQELGDFMKTAAHILVDKGSDDERSSQTSLSFLMPKAWPLVSDDDCDTIAALVQKAMEARVQSLIAGEGRYENPESRYSVRAFVRVKRSDGCPPLLVWSAPSEPFKIAPWYDNAGRPPVKITLPSVSDLRKLKPNVAFAMPEDLFNQLQRDGKAMLKGDPTNAGGMKLGLMWICAFNIPVITICAFIVLNIFLSLFDLFLHWMFFIKICLPIPILKKKTP